MTLSEIDRTLREIRVAPVRSLGQNFLHDQNLARWIVQRAQLTPEDFVVEIGPGLGALTAIALQSGARVLAIEKDARLAKFLRERFASSPLQVVHDDAMKFDLRPLFTERSVKLLGNLPYYIASQLLLKFTAFPSPFSLWELMLQREMAERICAAPGSSAYGALTLQLQLDHRVEYLRAVPPSVFVPQPEVDSALVRITPRLPNELPPCDRATFTRLVRLGFSQRRKQLRKLLRDEAAGWEEAAAVCKFEPAARAEELSLVQWIALSNLVAFPAVPTRSDDAAEPFVVVDENDREIGRAPRGEVHANNLRHRAVHILVFNRAGDLFLQKRSAWKDMHPHAWDSSAAGHVGPGESYEEAAARELHEELGVSAELHVVTKLPASAATNDEFIAVFRGEHDGPFRWPAREIEHGEFFPREIVRGWIAARPNDFAPAFLECWKAVDA